MKACCTGLELPRLNWKMGILVLNPCHEYRLPPQRSVALMILKKIPVMMITCRPRRFPRPLGQVSTIGVFLFQRISVPRTMNIFWFQSWSRGVPIVFVFVRYSTASNTDIVQDVLISCVFMSPFLVKFVSLASDREDGF